MLYFKQIKHVIFTFIVCTILSIPSYALFYSGTAWESPDAIEAGGFSNFLNKLTLGNLGEQKSNTLDFEYNPREPVKDIYLTCFTGTIGNIDQFGIGLIDRTADEQVNIDEDTRCNLELPFEQEFDETCQGNAFCSIRASFEDAYIQAQ